MRLLGLLKCYSVQPECALLGGSIHNRIISSGADWGGVVLTWGVSAAGLAAWFGVAGGSNVPRRYAVGVPSRALASWMNCFDAADFAGAGCFSTWLARTPVVALGPLSYCGLV